MLSAVQPSTQQDAERGAWGGRRRKAAQEGAAANYRTLLNEMVKDPEAHWQDWRPRLERDPQVRLPSASLCSVSCDHDLSTQPVIMQSLLHGSGGQVPRTGRPCCRLHEHPDTGVAQGRGTNPALESAQPESLFRDHVNDLHKRACAGFVDLMDATLKALLPPLPRPVRSESMPLHAEPVLT